MKENTIKDWGFISEQIFFYKKKGFCAQIYFSFKPLSLSFCLSLILSLFLLPISVEYYSTEVL